jgi:hypothetical protein
MYLTSLFLLLPFYDLQLDPILTICMFGILPAVLALWLFSLSGGLCKHALWAYRGSIVTVCVSLCCILFAVSNTFILAMALVIHMGAAMILFLHHEHFVRDRAHRRGRSRDTTDTSHLSPGGSGYLSAGS